MKNKKTQLQLVKCHQDEVDQIQKYASESRKYHFEVFEAASVDEINNEKHTERIDVIFLSAATGDAKKMIESCNSFLPDKPIIVLTSDNNSSSEAETSKPNMVDYIDINQLNCAFFEKTVHCALKKTVLIVKLRAVMRQANRSTAAITSIIENSTDGIVILSASNEIRLANSIAISLIEQGQTEIVNGIYPHNVDTIQKTEFMIDDHTGKRHIEQSAVELEWLGGPAKLILLKDITEQKQLSSTLLAKQEKEKFLSYHDNLTKLPNRQLFYDRLEQTLKRAKRNSYIFAILLIDIDGFKEINDTLGYDAGDEILKEAGKRIQEALRYSDTCARIGGDEFIVLADQIPDIHSAYMIAQKLKKVLSKTAMVDGVAHRLTASMGISLFPVDGVNSHTLLSNADTAMGKAKKANKNACCFYNDKINRQCGEVSVFERKLNNAIEAGQIVPYFQSQIDIKSGKIIGMEALVRWIDPIQGVISPAQFVPKAEKHGLINKIDRFMLHAACKYANYMRRNGFGEFRMSVNLNADLFRQEALPSVIDDILSEFNLPPYLLCLEITETQVMTHVESTIKILKNLKAMEVQISIDDFGTGYSSLSYLRQFPVDMLKVDRAFLNDVPSDRNNEAITAAIVALAKSMGLRVVAEGVELPEQIDFLDSLSCDEAQGFYISKPKSLEELKNFLLEQRRLTCVA